MCSAMLSLIRYTLKVIYVLTLNSMGLIFIIITTRIPSQGLGGFCDILLIAALHPFLSNPSANEYYVSLLSHTISIL